jgi:glutamate formiminotransferase/formiminotetrahydrofolate cyclodeaminase
MRKLIECVPNFSEGRDMNVIDQITSEIKKIDGVKLLDVDPGKATNRTVVTFVGEPDQVIEAAFQAIKKASELIDMSKHSGEHPRMGATDVCPLVPIANISMEEVAQYAHKLGKRVGEELGIPGYFYENAATSPERRNLATVRSGEYEGLEKKLTDPKWKPDFGPAAYDKAKHTGATAISARDFLVAYNINLNTTSTRRANAIAFDIREAGRIATVDGKVGSKPKLDENGNPIRIPGRLKAVKGIGWYIDEYGIAQISYNLTNISITSIHEAFDATCESAQERGLRVTGSELIGLVPLQAMLDAGKYFLRKQERSTGIPESEIIKIAVKSLGLDDLKPFNPKEKIIEYMLDDETEPQLIDMSLSQFADETLSDSPAPGGGSISAYVGSLGAALGTMVANLSSHKRGWDDRWEEFSNWAEKGVAYQKSMLTLVDEDTKSFNRILEAYRLPKDTEEEKALRSEAIQKATKGAIDTPYRCAELAVESMEVMKAMAEIGMKSSITDAAVGAMCARTAARGAFYNARINCADYSDNEYVNHILSEGKALMEKAERLENEILALVETKM